MDLERLIADAKRYQWLKSQADHHNYDGGYCGSWSLPYIDSYSMYAQGPFDFRKDFDAAIDRQMNKNSEPTPQKKFPKCSGCGEPGSGVLNCKCCSRKICVSCLMCNGLCEPCYQIQFY